MREEMQLNRRHWDEATVLHTRGNVYGIEDFKSGKCRLHPVEVREVGDVRGKSLLHLQCHFGLDTLSWARRGARVTGIDFSSKAIDAARRLSDESGTPAEFICADLYAAEDALPPGASFDIVYTSYGVICWLPDLAGWGRIIARCLRAGGFFYIVEAHPSARMFPIDADLKDAGPLRPYYSYFHNPAGTRWPGNFRDYADRQAVNSVGEHEWQHSMADIVNALIDAGLTMEWLHEFPFCAWDVVAGCQVVERFSDSHAYYGLPESLPQIPLMFSIRARKNG